MKSRAAQREETHERIVVAAAKAFSEKGFRAASTRDIAARAGVNQGLITYYFKSKQELWKAAAGRIFDNCGRFSSCSSRASMRPTDAPMPAS